MAKGTLETGDALPRPRAAQGPTSVIYCTRTQTDTQFHAHPLGMAWQCPVVCTTGPGLGVYQKYAKAVHMPKWVLQSVVGLEQGQGWGSCAAAFP